jgi:hypothetical protein
MKSLSVAKSLRGSTGGGFAFGESKRKLLIHSITYLYYAILRVRLVPKREAFAVGI